MRKNGQAVTDSNGREVLAFASEMRNLSRTAALLDAIVEMHGSGKWRSYETAIGHEAWRECEFDYFLIACEATYDEVSRVLSWNRQGKDLAASMTSEDARKRRPIEQASEAWHSPTGETLVDRAARQGWTNTRGALRPAPVPERARTKVRHGVTMDEHARRRREERIPASRRRELARRVTDLAGELSPLELRYIRDEIATKLANRGRPGSLDHEQMRRDLAELGGDLGALAKRWGTSRETAQKRVSRLGQ